MVGNKNWMDDHFKGGPTASPQPAKSPAPSGGGFGKLLIALFGVLLLAGGSVIAGDYYGLLQFGIFPKEAEPVVRRPDALNAPQFRAEPAPAPISEPVRAEPAPIPEPEPAAPVAVGPDAAKIKQLQARTAQLDRGVDLMGRETQEVEAKAQPCRWELTVRAKPFVPYSAAERIQNLDLYAQQHPRMTARDQADWASLRSAAVADFNNAGTRLKELMQKEASLQGRIDKAVSERAAIAAAIASP